MTPLQQLILEARSAAAHVGEPICRRTAFIDANRFMEMRGAAEWNERSAEDLQQRPALIPMVDALIAMMLALQSLDDPAAIRKAGEAILALTDAIRAETPRPQMRGPRLYWTEGRQA